MVLLSPNGLTDIAVASQTRTTGATADERLVWLNIVEADVDACSEKERDGKS